MRLRYVFLTVNVIMKFRPVEGILCARTNVQLAGVNQMDHLGKNVRGMMFLYTSMLDIWDPLKIRQDERIH